MATEKRLIDANALLAEFDRILQKPPFVHPATPWDRGLLLASVTALEMTTVDAVEVVRCKDCVCFSSNACLGIMPGYGFEVDPMDFCSYGERRTDNG